MCWDAMCADMVMSFYHYNDVTDRRGASVWLFVFYLSHTLVRGKSQSVVPENGDYTMAWFPAMKVRK